MTGSNQRQLSCPRCSLPLKGEDFRFPLDFSCPQCKLIMTGSLFPKAFMAEEVTPNPVESISDRESSCFFHAHKNAVSHCVECGRFLCSLCQLEIEGRILCPPCLKRLDEEKGVETFAHKTIFWDSIALSVALLPLLFWPITLISAPFALLLSLKHFNDPRSYIIPRKRWRLYLALFFSIIQISGWGYFFIRLFR